MPLVSFACGGVFLLFKKDAKNVKMSTKDCMPQKSEKEYT